MDAYSRQNTTYWRLINDVMHLITILAANIFDVNQLYREKMEGLIRPAMMKFRDSFIMPAPLLFVKATGGRKTLMRDIYMIMFCGVSLTIFPLLALGADQALKAESKVNQSLGNVMTTHLDEVHG